MQTKLLPVLLAATLVTCGLRAEDTSPASQPAAAPTSAPAPQVVTQAAPAPNQIIYSPRLPTAAELTNVAAAQGLAVEQINQTSNQITAIYKNANGQVTTVAYQLLPTAGTTTAATTVVVPSAPPTVVYQTAPRVIYYDTYDRGYDPFWPGYYPPVSLSLGFGYYHGWGGGHYHHWR